MKKQGNGLYIACSRVKEVSCLVLSEISTGKKLKAPGTYVSIVFRGLLLLAPLVKDRLFGIDLEWSDSIS